MALNYHYSSNAYASNFYASNFYRGSIEEAEAETGIIGPDTYALQKHLRNIDARDLIDIMGLVLISGILDE